MDLKKLFTEDRAVSPVIGVILMVAITVILAAVIGAFVLGIGGEQEAAPQASLSFSLDDNGDGVDIEHRGGDTLQEGELSFTKEGDSEDVGFSSGETFAPGEIYNTGDISATEDERVQLIHDPTGSVIGSGTL